VVFVDKGAVGLLYGEPTWSYKEQKTPYENLSRKKNRMKKIKRENRLRLEFDRSGRRARGEPELKGVQKKNRSWGPKKKKKKRKK